VRKLTPMQQRRLWLLLATVISLGIVGYLMLQAWGDAREARRRQVAFTESFAPSVYQLEREYLRFSNVVDITAHISRAPDREALGFALDLLESRLDVVDNSLAATDFRLTSEYRSARSLLGGAVQRSHALLKRPVLTSSEFVPIAHHAGLAGS